MNRFTKTLTVFLLLLAIVETKAMERVLKEGAKKTDVVFINAYDKGSSAEVKVMLKAKNPEIAEGFASKFGINLKKDVSQHNWGQGVEIEKNGIEKISFYGKDFHKDLAFRRKVDPSGGNWHYLPKKLFDSELVVIQVMGTKKKGLTRFWKVIRGAADYDIAKEDDAYKLVYKGDPSKSEDMGEEVLKGLPGDIEKIRKIKFEAKEKAKKGDFFTQEQTTQYIKALESFNHKYEEYIGRIKFTGLKELLKTRTKFLS